jgi:DNA-directed RNA polymerase specialized sigma24 family protein
MTVEEAAKKWGIAETTVRQYIRAGVVSGAYKEKTNRGCGFRWIIPDDAPCPYQKYVMRNAPTEKEAYILKYCGTLSIRSIAENLGISTAEVRNIFDRLEIEL